MHLCQYNFNMLSACHRRLVHKLNTCACTACAPFASAPFACAPSVCAPFGSVTCCTCVFFKVCTTLNSFMWSCFGSQRINNSVSWCDASVTALWGCHCLLELMLANMRHPTQSLQPHRLSFNHSLPIVRVDLPIDSSNTAVSQTFAMAFGTPCHQSEPEIMSYKHYV